MTHLAYKHILSVIDDYDVFLFDLWGVIIEGELNYPGVVATINEVINQQKKVFFVTNAPRSAIHLFAKIKSWGINTTSEIIISSGEIALDTIKKCDKLFAIKNPIVYHLGTEDNDLTNTIQKFTTSDINQANILLLTLYRDEGKDVNLDEFDDLLKIAVGRNIINICANPDIGIRQQGVQRYCAGYFAGKIEEFGGKVVYNGKPYPEIYHKILDQLGNIPRNRVLMIGDTFYTDILGANKMGFDSALVLTGNARKFYNPDHSLEEKLEDLRIAATEQKIKPSFVIELS
jgi:HAD superfamily hydrolase (TIGR01459 family)